MLIVRCLKLVESEESRFLQKGFSTIQQKYAAFGGTFNLESIEGKEGFTMEVII